MFKTHGLTLHPGIGHSRGMFSCLRMAIAGFNGTTHGHVLLIISCPQYYITPAASGIPTASERGAKSEVAHKWARWLHQPCRLGDCHRFRAGGKIRSGP